MIYLVLKATSRTRSLIKNFERFLQTYDLKILKYWDGKGTYELAVNTKDPAEIKWVNHLAIDFFNGELMSLRTELSESIPAQETRSPQRQSQDSGLSAEAVGD
jgi:hypothetical protein